MTVKKGLLPMDEQKDKITIQRDGESIRIHIPLKFKRRGGRKEIITPDGLPDFHTLLAPDIIEDILNGKEPSGLSLARLHKSFRTGWDDQRAALGFRPTSH